MNNDKWDQFAVATEKRYNNYHLNAMQLNNITDLNHNWQLIQKSIMNAAYVTIDYHVTSVRNKAEKKPKNLTTMDSEIKFLNKLITKLSTKNFPHFINELQKDWLNIANRINTIARKTEYL